MHRAIAEVAGHRAIAAAMAHVDHGEADLERLDAERRAEAREGTGAGKSRNLLTRDDRHHPWSGRPNRS